jgi:hypothetical protein
MPTIKELEAILKENDIRIKKANDIAIEAELEAEKRINHAKNIHNGDLILFNFEQTNVNSEDSKDKDIIDKNNSNMLIQSLKNEVNERIDINNIGNITIYGKVINFNNDFNWNWDVINGILDSKIYVYATNQFGETYQSDIKSKGEFFNNIGISGIYSSYLWIDPTMSQQNGYYLFPPKIKLGIEVKKDSLCLCSERQKIKIDNNSSSEIKLIKSDHDVKGKIVLKESVIFRKKDIPLGYVKINAFDKFNRIMSTISDKDGNFLLQLIDKDGDNNLHWSLDYELPSEEDLNDIYYGFQIVNPLTNELEVINGTDNFTTIHNNSIVYPTILEWDNEGKLVFTSYDSDFNTIDEDLSKKYLLPEKLLSHLSKIYNTSIKTNQDVADLVNVLIKIVVLSNNDKKYNEIFLGNNKLILPFTTNNFKSDEMINIKVASIQESIKLVFQITKDDSLAVNWNEIRLSLYYKEKTNDIWNFYENCSAIKRSRSNSNIGNFNCIIKKDDISKYDFKFEALTPNGTFPIFDVNSFSVETVRNMFYNYFDDKFYEMSEKGNVGEIVIDWEEPVIKFSANGNSNEYLPIFNLSAEYRINNNTITIKKNNINKTIIFKVPEEIRNNKNTKNIFGTIIASIPSKELVITKEFNLLNYNPESSNFKVNLDLFEFNSDHDEDNVWKIEYQLKEVTAEFAQVHKESIVNYYLRKDDTEVEMDLYYLNQKVDLLLCQDNNPISDSAYCVISGEGFHYNLSFINGKVTVFLDSKKEYKIEFSLGYMLKENYLPPNKQILDINNPKFNLMNKNISINVDLNQLTEGKIVGLSYNCTTNKNSEVSDIIENINQKFSIMLSKNEEWDIFITAEVEINNKIYLYTGSQKIVTDVENKVTINLNKSKFPYINPKRMIISSNIPNKIVIIDEKDSYYKVELIVPEYSIVNNNKKLFLNVQGSYQYLNNLTSKYATPFVVDCYNEDGQKITNCVQNKYFKYSYNFITDTISNGDMPSDKKDNLYSNIIKTTNSFDSEVLFSNEFKTNCTNCYAVQKTYGNSSYSHSGANQLKLGNSNNSKGHKKVTEKLLKDIQLINSILSIVNKNGYIGYHLNNETNISNLGLTYNPGWIRDSGEVNPRNIQYSNFIRNAYEKLSNHIGIKIREIDNFFDADIIVLEGETWNSGGVAGELGGFYGMFVHPTQNLDNKLFCLYVTDMPSDFTKYTILHEIGHNFGMTHPHDYKNMPCDIEGYVTESVMSYGTSKLDQWATNTGYWFTDLDLATLKGIFKSGNWEPSLVYSKELINRQIDNLNNLDIISVIFYIWYENSNSEIISYRIYYYSIKDKNYFNSRFIWSIEKKEWTHEDYIEATKYDFKLPEDNTKQKTWYQNKEQTPKTYVPPTEEFQLGDWWWTELGKKALIEKGFDIGSDLKLTDDIFNELISEFGNDKAATLEYLQKNKLITETAPEVEVFELGDWWLTGDGINTFEDYEIEVGKDLKLTDDIFNELISEFGNDKAATLEYLKDKELISESEPSGFQIGSWWWTKEGIVYINNLEITNSSGNPIVLGDELDIETVRKISKESHSYESRKKIKTMENLKSKNFISNTKPKTININGYYWTPKGESVLTNNGIEIDSDQLTKSKFDQIAEFFEGDEQATLDYLIGNELITATKPPPEYYWTPKGKSVLINNGIEIDSDQLTKSKFDQIAEFFEGDEQATLDYLIGNELITATKP